MATGDANAAHRTVPKTYGGRLKAEGRCSK